jgi:hypothetical protein
MVKPIELDPREALRNCGVHARQINEQIAEADKQRSDAVAAGDLDAVRKINRRVADLKNDLVTLAEGRALFETRVAQLDAGDRIAACDAAIEQLKPLAEAVIVLVEQLEAKLVEAGALKALIDAKFEEYRAGYPSILPRLPWYRSFELQTFESKLKQAFEDCSRSGLEKIDSHLDHYNFNNHTRRKPSAALREGLAKFIDDLRGTVRELETERAAKLEVAK